MHQSEQDRQRAAINQALLGLGSGKIERHASALQSLLVFSNVPIDRVCLVRWGFIDKSFQLLSSADAESQSVLVEILCNFPVVDTCSVLLRKKHLLKLLPKLLSSLNEKLQLYVLEIICCLSTYDDMLSYLVNEDFIPLVVPFLSSVNHDFQRFTVGLLANVLTHLPSQGEVVTCGGLLSVLKLLFSEDLNVRSGALGMVWNLMDNYCMNQRRRVVESGEVFLGSSKNMSDVNCFVRQCAVNRKTVGREDVIDALVSFLSVRECNIDVRTAGILKCLSVDSLNKPKIVKAGGIEVFVKLLDYDRVPLLQQVTAALKNLAVDESSQIMIGKLGGVSALFKLLSCSDSEVRKNAAGALWLLSLYDQNKAEIVMLGGIDHVAELNLSYISLPFKRVSCLFDFIAKNKSLRSLNLSHIEFTGREANLLLDAVIANAATTYLNVRHCGLEWSLSRSFHAVLCRNADGQHFALEYKGSPTVSRSIVTHISADSVASFEEEEAYESSDNLDALIASVKNAIKMEDIEAFIVAVRSDNRLLTGRLYQEKPLLAYVLCNSVKLLPVIIAELGNDFWRLRGIVSNGGLGIFRDAADHLGSAGAAVIQDTLKLPAKTVQEEYGRAKKRCIPSMIKACRRLGAQSVLMGKGRSGLSVISDNEEEEGPDLGSDPVVSFACV